MSDEIHEYGFACNCDAAEHNYDWMEQRVRQEVDALVAEGKVEIAGHPVRTKVGGMPYVYIPVRSNIPVVTA